METRTPLRWRMPEVIQKRRPGNPQRRECVVIWRRCGFVQYLPRIVPGDFRYMPEYQLELMELTCLKLSWIHPRSRAHGYPKSEGIIPLINHLKTLFYGHYGPI